MEVRPRFSNRRAGTVSSAVKPGRCQRLQSISRCRPRVDITLLAISSIEVCVVLSVGSRSVRNMSSAAATSRLQVSNLA